MNKYGQYCPTARAVEILGDRWGARWAFGEPDPGELNPVLLLWWMRDRVHIDRLPGRKVVVEFNFRMVRLDTG